MRKQTAIARLRFGPGARVFRGAPPKTYVQEQVGQSTKASDAKIGEVAEARSNPPKTDVKRAQEVR